MLVIAVTGGVGAGKTSLLGRLADWYSAEGRKVDGFLAVAGRRPAENAGAERYDLVMLSDRRTLPFAIRDDSCRPPYHFEESTFGVLRSWAGDIAARDRLPVLVLDEFGPLEAAGKGHAPLWPLVRAASPEVVVLAVREGLESAVQGALGISFDLRIEAKAGDAWERLLEACLEHKDWIRVGLFGAASGGFEASVGAILHGAQVPLRGLFLSSMQSMVMTYAGEGLGQPRRVVWVPFVAASMKALSPSGSRLRPMLAITIQGILYTLSILLLGWSFLGVGLGGFLIGAWSAVQGVALQYLFVGGDLVRAYDAVIHWVATALHLTMPGMVTLFLMWAGVCGAVASTVTLIAWTRRRSIPRHLRQLLARGAGGLVRSQAPPTFRAAIRDGARDLLRPFFWLPVLIVVAIVLAAGSALESAMWIVIRAAGIGLILFSLARSFDPQRFVAWLKKKGHWGPALAYDRVLNGDAPPDRPGGRDPAV